MKFELLNIQERDNGPYNASNVTVKLLPTTQLSLYYRDALGKECEDILRARLILQGIYPDNCRLELVWVNHKLNKTWNYDYMWQPTFHNTKQDRWEFNKYHSIQPYLAWHFIMQVTY
jgi:hypothetical protein